MGKLIDLRNKRFGRLLVIELSDSINGRIAWKCLCDCGNETVVKSTNLLVGKTRSCGCLNTERITKHGLSRTRVYHIWNGIKSRCLNPNNTRYADYGGRGIKICDRWLDFNKFYEDVSPSYIDGYSIDRYPNINGDYEPTNFRWATNKEQSRNQRRNRVLTIDGESKAVAEWAEISNNSISAIYTRLHRGWSDYDAVFKPNQKCVIQQ